MTLMNFDCTAAFKVIAKVYCKQTFYVLGQPFPS